MRKYWHIALMLFCVLMTTSCRDDDEALEVNEVWKVQNEEAFQTQVLVPGFEQLSSQSNAGFILYKILKTGEGEKPIYYTSEVELYYKASFIDGTVFQDKSCEAGAPYMTEKGASEFIDGFFTALQNIHPGDCWEIWIPQQLGYGPVGDKRGDIIIKLYTTLIYEVEVVRIIGE